MKVESVLEGKLRGVLFIDAEKNLLKLIAYYARTAIEGFASVIDGTMYIAKMLYCHVDTAARNSGRSVIMNCIQDFIHHLELDN
mmetsp:Transcript_10650/g.1613  ORF Transcript_10650/g.1613 Transcript_10650/m.1613 type:complete len:84 (-) Transcript_10650:18-269(-)